MEAKIAWHVWEPQGHHLDENVHLQSKIDKVIIKCPKNGDKKLCGDKGSVTCPANEAFQPLPAN